MIEAKCFSVLMQMLIYAIKLQQYVTTCQTTVIGK